MKLIFLILCFLSLIVCSCRKDKIDQTYRECYSEITEDSRAYFYNDAKEFGVQRLASDTLSDYILNPVYREEQTLYVLGKLSAIYNEATDTSSPLHDMIFKYEIHKQTEYWLDWLIITFDSTETFNDFTENLGESQNPILNELVTKFGFKIKSKSTYFKQVILISEVEYITPVFAYRLKNSVGIEESHAFWQLKYEWNDIFYSWTDEYDEFIFELGMGDCPLGCTEFHYWKVRVDHDCTVSLVSEYGDPIPG